MELKRIIARDTRAANEKAVALYGPDVLVISTSKVRGKTELIVAVDVEPMNAEVALAETFVPTEKTYSLSATSGSEESPLVQEEPASFGKVLDDTMAMHKRQTKPAKADATGFVSAASLKKAAQEKTASIQEEALPVQALAAVAPSVPAQETVVQPQVVAPTHDVAEERDAMRGREIVQMVREELATLRKEFKLSQQMAWQGTGLARNLMPLRNALQEAAIPVALRALLIDSIQSFEDVEPAMDEIRRQLCHSMQHSSVTAPDQGVHVLAGPSGAGKSTVLQLLMRFYDPQSGVIRLDGVPLADLRREDFRAHMALVPQDPVIFAASAMDNIRFGRPGATDAEVREAAQAAAAHEFIAALPQGYDTWLGERLRRGVGWWHAGHELQHAAAAYCIQGVACDV